MVAGRDKIRLTVSVDVDDSSVNRPDPGAKHYRFPVWSNIENVPLTIGRDVAGDHVQPSVSGEVGRDRSLGGKAFCNDVPDPFLTILIMQIAGQPEESGS